MTVGTRFTQPTYKDKHFFISIKYTYTNTAPAPTMPTFIHDHEASSFLPPKVYNTTSGTRHGTWRRDVKTKKALLNLASLEDYKMYLQTGMTIKVGPRLRDPSSWLPLAPQTQAHLFDHPCTAKRAFFLASSASHCQIMRARIPVPGSIRLRCSQVYLHSQKI